MRIKLWRLMKVVLKEKKKAKKIFDKTRNSAIEIAKTAQVSYSAAGDRYHAAGSAYITEERLTRLKNLCLELKQFTDQSPKKEISVPSYVKVNFDGEIRELYLVENPTLLGQHQLISKGSFIGSLLFGKKKGDVITTQPAKNKIEILEVG